METLLIHQRSIKLYPNWAVWEATELRKGLSLNNSCKLMKGVIKIKIKGKRNA